MATSSNIKIYRPLSDQQIRIIDLYPGEGDSPVTCTLYSSPLDASFEALSYCWGDPSDRTSIICNGVSILVTKCLFGALKALRTSKVRSLWVDAICINQDDIDERNAQVQLMAQIYQTAQQVVIWLGEHEADTAPAMDILSGIAQGTKLDSGQNGLVPYKQTLERCGMPPADDPAWKSLRIFFSRPWFTRMWVVQEAILGLKVIVICGNRQITWDDFHSATEAIDNVSYGGLVGMQNLFIMGLQRYKRRREEKDLDLTRLLFGERVQSATDDRDKIFALLGLATDVGGVLQLRANYHMKTADVFINSARSIINAHRSLSILSASGLPSPPNKYNLPSWAPDWSTGDNAWPLMCRVGELNFAACRGAKAEVVSAEGTSLNVSTVEFDVISELSPPFPPENRSQTFMSWIKLAKAEFSDEERLAAFLRTTIANLGSSSEAPTTYDKMAFLEWYKRILLDNNCNLPTSPVSLPECSKEEAEARHSRFSSLVAQAASNRSFFVTKNGSMGIGPRKTAIGDLVCIVNGACVPLILREAEGDQRDCTRDGQKEKLKFSYIGDAYVDGIMNGEAYDEIKLRHCEII